MPDHAGPEDAQRDLASNRRLVGPMDLTELTNTDDRAQLVPGDGALHCAGHCRWQTVDQEFREVRCEPVADELVDGQSGVEADDVVDPERLRGPAGSCGRRERIVSGGRQQHLTGMCDGHEARGPGEWRSDRLVLEHLEISEVDRDACPLVHHPPCGLHSVDRLAEDGVACCASGGQLRPHRPDSPLTPTPTRDERRRSHARPDPASRRHRRRRRRLRAGAPSDRRPPTGCGLGRECVAASPSAQGRDRSPVPRRARRGCGRTHEGPRPGVPTGRGPACGERAGSPERDAPRSTRRARR